MFVSDRPRMKLGYDTRCVEFFMINNYIVFIVLKEN